MYSNLLNLHDYFAVVSASLLIILFIKTLFDFITKNKSITVTKKISLLTLIILHSQLVIGILLYLNKSVDVSVKILGKVTYIEHMASNIVAIGIFTFFHIKLKKSTYIKLFLPIMLFISIILLARVVPLLIEAVQKIYL